MGIIRPTNRAIFSPRPPPFFLWWRSFSSSPFLHLAGTYQENRPFRSNVSYRKSPAHLLHWVSDVRQFPVKWVFQIYQSPHVRFHTIHTHAVCPCTAQYVCILYTGIRYTYIRAGLHGVMPTLHFPILTIIFCFVV